MPVEYGEFKGNKIIKLMKDENDQYPFSFGLSKARLIVENFEEIKNFVESEGSGDDKFNKAQGEWQEEY